MQFYKYNVVDHKGWTRIGYIEAESLSDIQEKFQKSGVQKVNGVTEVTVTNIQLLNNRNVFTFVAQASTGEAIHGSIEQISSLDAYKELTEDGQLQIQILVEGEIKDNASKELLQKATNQLKSKYQQLKQNKEIDKATQRFFQTTAEEIEEEHVTSLMDKDFKNTLRYVKDNTEDVALDKQFEEEVKDIHMTIGVLLERPVVSLEQKYDYLAFLLRQLSYVENMMDESPMKEHLKKVLGELVEALQKVEKLKLQKKKQSTPQQEQKPIPPSRNPIYKVYIKRSEELQEEKTQLKHDAKQLFVKPGKKSFTQLKDTVLRYQQKKEYVKSLERELALQRETHLAQNPDTLIDVRSSFVMLREIPIFSQWLVLIYIVFFLIGETVSYTGVSFQLSEIPVSDMLIAISTSLVNVKIITLFFLGHTFLTIWKKYYKNSTILVISFSFLIVSIVGLFFFI